MNYKRTRIKICCISSVDEARMATEAGADALGLVGKMPSGPGPIPDELIREIASTVPPPVSTFLLTSETSVDQIINHHLRTRTNTIQIVDMLTDGTYRELRDALPEIKIVQVIHVIDNKSVKQALEISEEVNAVLLDSGNPNLRVKELGGTGRTHDWSLSLEIVNHSRCPVFLAGGLNPENVGTAITTVHPYAVDICSGVRTNGLLDIRKLKEFIKNVRQNDKI
jgi:phosphoribosylanthranilate isomerase